MAVTDVAQVRTWASRRRALGLVAALSLAFIGVVFEQMDMPLHTVDDYLMFVLSLVVLILYLAWRKHEELDLLKRDVNVFTALLAAAYIVKFAWYFVEIGEPEHAGDDMLAWLSLAVILVNRFI